VSCVRASFPDLGADRAPLFLSQTTCLPHALSPPSVLLSYTSFYLTPSLTLLHPPSLSPSSPLAFPSHLCASGLYKKAVVEADGKRIDQAFNSIFYRAPVTQKEDSYDIVSSRIIAFLLVSLALQILLSPVGAWCGVCVYQKSMHIFTAGCVSCQRDSIFCLQSPSGSDRGT
jgi:hypothetical protein